MTEKKKLLLITSGVVLISLGCILWAPKRP